MFRTKSRKLFFEAGETSGSSRERCARSAQAWESIPTSKMGSFLSTATGPHHVARPPDISAGK